LKILRDGKLLDFVVIRQKIIIQNIDFNIYKKENSNICLISISMFDFGVAKNFQTVMSDLQNKNCSKYIFDVRNNPG
jgi:C-terminal processing protease CtpA/Prc